MVEEHYLDKTDEYRNGELEDGPVLSAACKHVVADAVTTILRAVGEDPEREGLLSTPNRVARAYDELLIGYRVDPVALLNNALFDVTYSEMVIVTDIDFYSLCEHHMLPFIGKAHVAYIPDKKVVGLSKIPRIVEVFARRLQIQERMTRQIAELIDELLNPLGVAVVVDGLHMCMAMRGVKKANARMRTSALRGAFAANPKTRSEFMEHIGPVSRVML
ncbi:MAG: GTP cyclohydrolase I FolE [Anaerolineae bacterium]|nr:GTP cyclohydrolase I FolE [Anaerolineae bacterium]RIK17069.1 MAG: GTP cyclohydrolase I FolE [Anaerolineae bacterium]